MSRLDLPDGQWAELCAARKVPERKRRRYENAVLDLNAGTADLPRDPENPDRPDSNHFSAAHGDLMGRMSDMLILCFVREWSFGDVTVEVLEELPHDAYEVLKEAADGLMKELMPDMGVDPDPKAPTSGSTGPLPGSSTGDSTSGILSSVGTS